MAISFVLQLARMPVSAPPLFPGAIRKTGPARQSIVHASGTGFPLPEKA
jgi:hypothetical protein